MGRKLTVNVKENQKEYMKKYFQDNKEMTACDCGCIIDKYSMRRHLLSKKHVQLIEYNKKIKELENLGKIN
jgi:hypothetical protein